MPRKCSAMMLVLMLAVSTTGCCRWAQRHCPQCQQASAPPPMSYQSAAPMCCPAPVCCPAPCCPAPAPSCCPAPSQYQPVSAQPQGGWQRNYGGQQACYCQ